MKKCDGKAKRSAPSVNGVAPGVNRSARDFSLRYDASSSRDRYGTLMVPATSAGS